MLRQHELCNLQRVAARAECLVEDAPFGSVWIRPLIYAGESDIDVDLLLVPVWTGWDYVAELQSEFFDRFFIEQGFNG